MGKTCLEKRAAQEEVRMRVGQHACRTQSWLGPGEGLLLHMQRHEAWCPLPPLHSCFCRAAASWPRLLRPKAAVTTASTAKMGSICRLGGHACRRAVKAARLAAAGQLSL